MYPIALIDSQVSGNSLRTYLFRARGAQIPFESAFYCPDFSRSSRVIVPRGFEQLSETGAFAQPEKATAEKGELLFEVAARGIVNFVREFATWSNFDPQ